MPKGTAKGNQSSPNSSPHKQQNKATRKTNTEHGSTVSGDIVVNSPNQSRKTEAYLRRVPRRIKIELRWYSSSKKASAKKKRKVHDLLNEAMDILTQREQTYSLTRNPNPKRMGWTYWGNEVDSD